MNDPRLSVKSPVNYTSRPITVQVTTTDTDAAAPAEKADVVFPDGHTENMTVEKLEASYESTVK